MVLCPTVYINFWHWQSLAVHYSQLTWTTWLFQTMYTVKGIVIISAVPGRLASSSYWYLKSDLLYHFFLNHIFSVKSYKSLIWYKESSLISFIIFYIVDQIKTILYAIVRIKLFVKEYYRKYTQQNAAMRPSNLSHSINNRK